MIESKNSYREYLIADKIALGRNRKRPQINDYIWKYEILTRKIEYYHNCKKGYLNRFIEKAIRLKRSKLGAMCGFSIPINVVGKGLCISHIGTIIISEYATVGKNFRVHAGVNIGADFRNHNAAPNIGDNVYIGPGAKLFGDIYIADNIAVGANSVVNKSFYEPNISIAGVPARKISEQGNSEGNLKLEAL